MVTLGGDGDGIADRAREPEFASGAGTGRRPKSLGKVQCDILTGDITIGPLEFYYVDMETMVTIVLLHCRNYISGWCLW